MALVRAVQSFAGLLACMGAGQEAEVDDEAAAEMAECGYPVEIVDDGAGTGQPDGGDGEEGGDDGAGTGQPDGGDGAD